MTKPKATDRPADPTTTLFWLADLMIMPVALVRDGEVVHCNTALERMLEDEDEAGMRTVRDELAAVAHSISGTQSPRALPDERPLRVRTKTRRYWFERLPAPLGGGVVMAIRLHRSRVPLDVEWLAARFGFTPREAEVARLVAAGLSNKAVAAELHLSPHTSRRHTESVFRKAGVSSRAALAALIHGR